jgi:hypothetical protein
MAHRAAFTTHHFSIPNIKIVTLLYAGKRLARFKNSSLLGPFVSYKENEV